MSVVPQLEAKITAVKQWRQTAKRAFISTKNSCKLLEVFNYVIFVCHPTHWRFGFVVTRWPRST